MSKRSDTGHGSVPASRQVTSAPLVANVAALSAPPGSDPAALTYPQAGHDTPDTALSAARRDLADAQARHVEFFERAPVGYLVLDADANIVEINQTATTLLATPRSHLVGHRLTEFIATEDCERWCTYHASLMHSTERRHCELRLCLPSGECFVARLAGGLVTWSKAPRSVCIAVTDLSDARQLDSLKESSLRLKLAVEAFSGGLYDWNRHTGQVYWSSALKHVFGAHNGELGQGRRWWRSNVHPDDLRRIRPLVRAVIRKASRQLSVEYRIRSFDGRWIYVADHAHIERDTRGRICRLVGTLIDISATKAAVIEQEQQNELLEKKVALRTAEAETRARDLAEAERFARGIIDSLSSRLCVLDEHGEIIATNRPWRAFADAHCSGAGKPPHRPPRRHAPLGDWTAPTTTAVRDAIEDMLADRRKSYQLEYESRVEREIRWFNMTVTRFAGEGPVRLVVRHDDITPRKLIELDHERTALQIKQLGRHLQSAREAQSALIARELHDELGASLTMLKLSLATMAEEADRLGAFEGRFAGLVKQVDCALRVVKRISGSLRPAMLDALGLIATIRWYLPQFSDATGIPTLLRLPEYVRLSDAANIIVFRIIQEGLTNVAKHAHATRAWVHVQKHRGRLLVHIADNGIGISDTSVHRRDAFGIVGMRERAQSVGGELAIVSRQAGGTRLSLCIPINS